MGRLVGIGGVLIVVAVVGLFLGFGAYFAEDTEGALAEKVAAASNEANAIVIDPACLWPLLDTSFSPDAPSAPSQVNLQNCAPADAEIVLDGDWNRVSLQRGEPGKADFERRFSGARAAHHSEEGWIAVEAYDNWGGSGVFSSLVAGRLAADGAALRDIKVHAFGDRCNGGLAGAAMNAGGRLTASANMTPWDIMIEPFADLPFEAQWEAGKARFGAAFGQASSCAICCSAVTREYGLDDQRGLVAVGLRYDPGTAPSSEDALTVCLEDAVCQAAGADALVEAAERATLGPLIDSCAKSISN
jgi:hypothetical protein